MAEKFKHLKVPECGPHCIAKDNGSGRHTNVQHCDDCHGESWMAMEDRPAHGPIEQAYIFNTVEVIEDENAPYNGVLVDLESTLEWSTVPHTHGGTDCPGGRGCPVYDAKINSIKE